MTGHHKIALRISLLSAVLLTLAGPLATYRFGLTGLTIVSIAATITECGLQWYFTKSLVGVWTHFSPLAAIPRFARMLSQRATRQMQHAGIAANDDVEIAIPSTPATEYRITPQRFTSAFNRIRLKRAYRAACGGCIPRGLLAS